MQAIYISLNTQAYDGGVRWCKEKQWTKDHWTAWKKKKTEEQVQKSDNSKWGPPIDKVTQVVRGNDNIRRQRRKEEEEGETFHEKVLWDKCTLGKSNGMSQQTQLQNGNKNQFHLIYDANASCILQDSKRDSPTIFLGVLAACWLPVNSSHAFHKNALLLSHYL